jgi:hypothetical protein
MLSLFCTAQIEDRLVIAPHLSLFTPPPSFFLSAFFNPTLVSHTTTTSITATTMSIQMTLVFIVAAIESVIVAIQLLPLPAKLQNLLIQQYDKLIQNSNFAIVVAFIDVLVGIMFTDATKNGFTGWRFSKPDEIIEFSKNVWDARAKKFYSQRNMYILGAIIALQGCMWFNVMMLRSMVKNKKKLVDLSKAGSVHIDSTTNDTLDVVIEDESTKELREELKKLETDVSALKKQYDNLWDAYKAKTSTVTVETVVEKKDK